MTGATPSLPNSASFRQRLLAGMTVLGLLVAGALAWKIYASDAERQRIAKAQTQSLVKAVEEHVLHTIQLADISLNGFANAIKAMPSSQRGSATVVGALLAANGASFSAKFQVLFIDADGIALAASDPVLVHSTSHAHRDYFQFHRRRDAGNGLYVGKPVIAREDGRRVFFLSRRVESAEGKFVGVIVARMDASRLAAVFDSMRSSQYASVVLAHRGGAIIARAPHFEQTFAAGVAQTDLFERTAGAPAGSGISSGTLDGQTRFYSYRALEDMPLLVSVSIASREWEEALRRDVRIGLAGLVLMAALMFGGGTLAVRSYARLERSENSYRRLYSSLRDGVVLIDCADCIAECNDAFLEIVGYDAQDIIGSDFLPWSPDQWRTGGARKEQDLNTLDQYEKECRRKTGETIYLNIKLWPINYSVGGNALMMLALVRDVTDQKRTQNALRQAHDDLEVKVLQRTAALVRTNEKLKTEISERKLVEEELRKSKDVLQQLSAHQERIKEIERKRIAREIHDDLGQSLLALRIDVSMMHARTAETHPKLHRKANTVLENIDGAIRSVKSIINNLRPATLELGLDAAIEWQVKEFERISGIRCHLTLDTTGICFDRDDERALALFRILQESLTNIARHAQASAVTVMLRVTGSRLCLRVTDNGIGIQPAAGAKPNAFGLVGMRERIHSLGGALDIESGAGHGTVITVYLEIRKDLVARTS
ncbi:PAS domain S-box protein [Janthinobacterium sp. 17J80-10]|uniref:PAS domain S-box protein n=1 Tax=Janthinobacterium sp. 17J80-10 TaxID=2497863 RepID=UPI00100598DB|nr:PAS domain S-box protein [Janthinobacterium sp. 17J80-10]QAU33208.1 PAS domain S-box protein [Janthinobacterium sp. 17J80-10]